MEGMQGLTQAEAEQRLLKYGRNKLPEEKKDHWFLILLRQVNSAMVYVLLVASVVSFALGDRVDAAVILVAVILNVSVGFIQEYRAEQSLNRLKTLVAKNALVLRNGKEVLLNTEEIVPGDVLLLRAGDHVTADAHVMWAESFEVLESALTGESEAVEKNTNPVSETASLGDRTNMVFAGTSVINGQGQAIVSGTGAQTELGKIATALRETSERPTPLQKQLNRFSRFLAGVIGVLTLLLFIVGLIIGRPVIETFTLAVAIAVSALPEGLIIGVTVILAIGMKRILQHKGLVRRLASAETLGSVTVICTDKTGTLTEGKMRVDHWVTWDHALKFHREHPEKELAELFMVITIGLLNNDAKVLNPDDEAEHWEITGNLTERALLFAGATLGLDHKKLQAEHPRIHAIPFNSTSKIMATLHTTPDHKKKMYVKGAPERVLDMCENIYVKGKSVKMTKTHRDRLTEDFSNLSKRGLRVLALAYADLPKTTEKVTDEAFANLVFAGFLGIKDGLRAEAKIALEACERAGIKVKMITGDHKLTAQAIAQELGLPAKAEHIVDGVELGQMSEPDLVKRISDIAVFARVSPQDKYRIVKALQKAGQVVAMTGDGVNDAPALKASDIGVALGSGTDVAKDAADLIILDDNFQTIVTAVREGRVIFDNIKKSVLFLVSASFSEIVLVSLSIVLGLPVPLIAVQILWINLVTDTFPNLALTQEPQETQVMNEPPRSPKARIINKDLAKMTAIVSGASGLASLGLFMIVYEMSDSIDYARTVTFAALSLQSLFYVFSVKSLRLPVWRSSLFNNKSLLLAVGLGIVLMVLATTLVPLQNIMHTTYLGFAEWAVITGISLVVLGTIEVLKMIFLKRRV